MGWHSLRFSVIASESLTTDKDHIMRQSEYNANVGLELSIIERQQRPMIYRKASSGITLGDICGAVGLVLVGLLSFAVASIL
jgi:hypothetical protein